MENPVVLRARQRVLFFIFKKGKNYRANISQVARDMHASDGNINQYVNQLIEKGYLKVVRKRGVEYFRVTLKGEANLYPILLPRLLTYFIMIVAFALIIWSEPPLLFGQWTISPYVLLFTALVLLVFSGIMLWTESKMDAYLLESHLVSNS